MIRTVRDLLHDVADNCDSVLDRVVATTPHGTYTFEIVDIRGGDQCLVLDLREIKEINDLPTDVRRSLNPNQSEEIPMSSDEQRDFAKNWNDKYAKRG